jgi:hypothetical protein
MNGKRTAGTDRRRRRLKTAGWSLALLLITILLIAFEKIAILYVLATLGVCGLLFIVAVRDLHQHEPGTAQTPSQKGDASIVARSTK